MPRHIEDLQNDDPFPVQPETNQYHALSLLVANREFGFTPAEIAERTPVSETSASKTMARLFEKGLVERTQGTYYIEPDRADELKRRLDSIDAAARLFERTPDDAYAEAGWEDDVPSLSPAQPRSDTEEDTGTSDVASEATTLVDDLASRDEEGRE